MNISTDSYLTINNILGDVTRITGDEDMRSMAKGWYVRQVKRALDELNYRVQFDERYIDFDVPQTFTLKIPKGFFNIKDIFVYNTECFSVDTSHRVHHKDNFIRTGAGYTARVKDGQYDYFNQGFSGDEYMLFYNVQNGVIYFSDYIENFDRIRIVFNGVASEISDEKIIPPFAQQAIIHWVCIEYFKAKMISNPNNAYMYKLMKEELYGQKSRGELCVWDETKYMLKRLDDKQRSDKNEYWGRLNA